MIKGRILATEIGGNPVAGSCELVYQDAIASGTSEYVLVALR